MAQKITAKNFLETLASIAESQRKLIESDCPGFDSSKTEIKRRRTKCLAKTAEGFRFFCETYFPHYVKSDHSAFHVFLHKRLSDIISGQGGARDLIAAPRGNAKSTYVAFLFPIWCLILRAKKFPVILSDTFEQAAVHLSSIKTELEFNPRLRLDFPDDTGVGPVWQVSEIVTTSGAKVKIGGSGKALRGFRHGAQRPDLVICDDLENDENVKSPDQRDKLEAWVDKTVEPLGPPDGSMDLIWVNTFLHFDSVAMRKSRNPLWTSTIFKAVVRWPDRMDLWDKWEEIIRNFGKEAAEAFYIENKSEMLTGAEVLWPGMQPLYRLMEIRVRTKRSSFGSEYQNEPMDGSDQLFANLTFWVNRLPNWVFVGVCDPSLGKQNKGRDPSAILIGGFNRETGILDVVEASIARRLPTLIIDHIIGFQREYRCIKWGIETVQFQEFFRTQLISISAKNGVPVPAIPLLNSVEKSLRIETLQPHTQNGLIRVHPHQTELLAQLQQYPQHQHDDGPDALEMLWRIAQSIRSGRTAINGTGQRQVTRTDFQGFMS